MPAFNEKMVIIIYLSVEDYTRIKNFHGSIPFKQYNVE